MGNKLDVSCMIPEYDAQITNPSNRDTQCVDNRESQKSKQTKLYNLKNSIKNPPINNKSKKFLKTQNYINKVKILQRNIRYALAIKKFNEHIDLLKNILELDSTVNVIKDKNLEKELLSKNIGEQLSQKLLLSKKILPYNLTKFYQTNIKKYKPNRYLIKTPLTYIDKYKNNNLYIGTWTLEKKFHGYGIYYIEENKYEGFWNFGKLEGECQYFLKNKDYFIGNFMNGQANGLGKYFHNDGTIYDGNWLNDRPNGNGKEIFSDGSKFEGFFENGYKKYGKFQWADSSFYEGEIKKNTFDGKGIFHWKEGKEYNGEWKEGKMNGKGIMKYIDGTKYDGNFVNGKREGEGLFIFNENKFYNGYWKNGKQHGKGYFYNKGKGIKGIWKDGNLVECISTEIEKNIDKNQTSPNRKYNNIDSNESFNISYNMSNNNSRKKKLIKKDKNKNNNNNDNISDKKIGSSKNNNYKEINSLIDLSVISTSTNKTKMPGNEKYKQCKPKKAKKISMRKSTDIKNFISGDNDRLYKSCIGKSNK